MFDYYRVTFVNILVDEDQEVPEPRDSSLSMITTHLAPY